MYYLVTLLLLFSFSVIGAVNPAQSILEAMRESASSIGGSFTLASPVNLMRDTSGVIPKTLELKAKPVLFSFDEHKLNLNTYGAMYFWLGGIKCKIKSIGYDDRTGQFSVTSDTPLGLFDSKLEGKIKAALEQIYKPKLQRAFAELRQIRQEKSVDQAKQSIQTIIKALASDGNGPKLPEIYGNVSLNFSPKTNRRIMLTEDLGATVSSGDQIRIGGDFILKDKKTTFQTMEFQSTKGIQINPSTKWPEVKSINLKEVTIGAKGLSVNYGVGGEDVIKGLILTLNLMTTDMSQGPSAIDCPPEVEVASIRGRIDRAFMTEFARLLKTNRQALIAAGVNSRLIDGLIKP